MASLALKMIKTVEAEYLREMKKCYVMSEMMDKTNRDKFINMKIEIRKEQNHVNYYGTIGVLPSLPHYHQTSDYLGSHLLITNDDKRVCLNEFSKKSAEKIYVDMFMINIPSNNLPMSDQLFTNT